MKTILNAIKHLKNQLEDFEESAEIDATHSLPVPAILYVHSKEKILYGDYTALSTLGYKPSDLGQSGRRILMDNLHPSNTTFRNELFEHFKKNEDVPWVGTYQLKGKDNQWHTLLAYAEVHTKDEENNVEHLIINIEIDITGLKSSENYQKAADRALWSTVTKRENQIIKQIAQGSRNQDIAASLNISLNTVETHRKNLLRKLGMKNTTSLIYFVTKYRLLD